MARNRTTPATPPHPFAATRKSFTTASGKQGQLYSLPELSKTHPNIRRLPVSIRIVLESVLRNCDGVKVGPEHVAQLANWQPNAPRSDEIPFVVARVVLQDFTGVPLLADLAAMRNVAADMGRDPKTIEPLVPVDLVVDHSVMVDHYGTKQALDLNMKLEFQRNQERYQFMKWGMQAFDTFGVVPPGFGIVHQVNLEYLARGVHKGKDDVYYPDTLVGTDSHTTMINGIGVVGWGVGGIEAEAGMLGQPVYFLTPDVVGLKLTGRLREGCTATDLVLTVTELLRSHKVVGKFVEFFGEGTRTLALPDRATIANMAPEYGATMGFFPVDERTIDYFKGTGRSKGEIEAFEAYFKAQQLFGVPGDGEIDYSQVVELDLGTVAPSLAGPKRPQDRITLTDVSTKFGELFSAPAADNGFNQPADKLAQSYTTSDGLSLRNGDVLIAAITSCTNTSNPSVLLAAGLLAKKAVEAGPEGQAAHQDLAGAGLAHRHRIPGQDRSAALPGKARLQRRRLRLHHLHRQCRRPDGVDQRGHHRQRPGLCGRAVGQPQLRGAHPPQPEGQLPGQPAAGGGLRDRRQHDGGRDDPAAGPGAQGQAGVPGRRLAEQRRGACAAEVRDGPEGLPPELRQRRHPPGQAVERHQGRRGPGLQLAAQQLHRAAALLPRLHDDAEAAAGRRAARRASWRCSATRSPPTTSRRPVRSRRPHPPASTCWHKACARPISTATVRAAATTR